MLPGLKPRAIIISTQPIYCILPPHVSSAIAERGTPRQRARALP